ncbi:MAG TPA: hypothetical protein VLT13_05915 [Bacteroidota bacterium]|nr:hypothetical protein [Bacteroidota bacterium]
MKTRRFVPVVALLFVCSLAFSASPMGETALWIEITEKGGHKTVIAMTEFIARLLLESEKPGHPFMRSGERELLTREKLEAVLDGDEESVEAVDEDGSAIRLYMEDLDIPGDGGKDGKLVIETYKSGSRTFRLALPEIELEVSEDEDEGIGSLEMSFGWRGLIPYLKEEGGAIYVVADEGETEVWVYFE